MSADVWIVLVEDRHADVDALPFSSEERAVKYARTHAQVNASHPEYIEEEELTPAMRKEGWVLLVRYSAESDCVRVVRRTMDGAS